MKQPSMIPGIPLRKIREKLKVYDRQTRLLVWGELGRRAAGVDTRQTSQCRSKTVLHLIVNEIIKEEVKI